MPAGLVGVVREDELEGEIGPTEPPGGIDAWREPEPDGARVDGRGVDAGAPHERLEARAAGRGERPEAGRRERPVLVDERDDVRDRRQRDEVEVATDGRVIRAEERLAELVYDARSAQLGKRVARRPGGHDRAVGKDVAGPVVVGDDHVEPATRRLRDLLDRRDPAVDRQEQPDTVVREPAERLSRDAVTLLEPARQVPVDVGSELAQEQHRERCRADAVDVVVPVDADSFASFDGVVNLLDGGRHVAQQERVVAGELGVQEASRAGRVVVPASGEHRRRYLADADLASEHRRRACIDRCDRPRARHAGDGTEGVGRRIRA